MMMTTVAVMMRRIIPLGVLLDGVDEKVVDGMD
jgi:hypothetical protein